MIKKLLLALCIIPTWSYAEPIRLAVDDLSAWQEKEFSGKTSYKIVQIGQQTVIHANSQQAASGLFQELDIDLTKTPWLHWRWKIASTNTTDKRNEKSKQGDDYTARIYVIHKAGLFGLGSKAVNYVWSANQSIGSHWPNAYTSSAMMMVVQSGNEQAGKWLWQSRNVQQDFKILFDADIQQINSIALMTDTDNAGGVADAWYGEIYFSNSPEPEQAP